MNDLTILIPSKLKKENYKKINFILSKFTNTKIIIISDQKLSKKIYKVDFLKTKKKDLLNKIIYGLKKVKTQNVLLLPDDEFPIVNSIRNIYSIFKKNKKISTCIGIKFYFDSTNPRIFYPINHHSFTYYNSKNKNNYQIENSIKFYTDSFWCFHRTNLLKNFFKFYEQNKSFNSLYFLEYNIILYMKIFGAVRYFKFPWSFRSKTSKKWSTLQNFCTLYNFKSKFKKEFDFLAKNYCGYNNIKLISSSVKLKFYSAFTNRYLTLRPQDHLKNFSFFNKYVFLIKKIFYKYFFLNSNLEPQLVDLYYVNYYKKKNFQNLFKKKYLKSYAEIINYVWNNKL